jgi:hypothetical protein
MGARVLRAQRDVVARYRRISNLYVAYTNSDGSPGEYGREFFIAVGEILEGKSIEQLELFHIDVSEIEDVVAYGQREVPNDREPERRPYKRPAVSTDTA